MDSAPALAVPIWILPELVAPSFLTVMKALRFSAVPRLELKKPISAMAAVVPD